MAAEAVPQIRVTDPQSRDAALPMSPIEGGAAPATTGFAGGGVETVGLAHTGGGGAGGGGGTAGRPSSRNERPATSNGIHARSATPIISLPQRGRAGTTATQYTVRGETERSQSGGGGGGGGAAIDPLSQHIFKRTHTQSSILSQKKGDGAGGGSGADPRHPGELARSDTGGTTSGGGVRDKKKGVSFLSRFIGNKKKGSGGATTADSGGTYEDASEASEVRPEGMDAQLFSQPIDNIGFSPRHPHPPGYIKFRAKFKRAREFNRVFLAQELQSPMSLKRSDTARTASTTGSGTATMPGPPPPPPPTPSPANGLPTANNPTWALEFSRDGRYLASGGQDRVVRVWAVITSPEERRAHEKDEITASMVEGATTHLSAPVFQKRPIREYEGHTATVLDLSWSKNNFLLSSSMDKTVRLWHISRPECLCTFKHTDFVPSIQFHPRDDRFFLAGSLDTKLRLWSIPDKSVAYWNQLPDMITAVAFTPDGKTAIAGTLSGLCLFYETEGLKYQTQIHVKSSHGKNAKGSKITGIQAFTIPPDGGTGELKLLISSNDSRIRLYNFRDKSLEVKFKGHENNCSQIRASFTDDGKYVICGSEDRRAYIWSTGPAEGEKRNQRPVEMFDAHNTITTCAVLAPTKTRQLLSASEDPVYDICNPPPVTLLSRLETESIRSWKPPTDNGSAQGTPVEPPVRKAEESPAYIARSAHPDGNIIVTADYTGSIKVFRQDCAYEKRLKSDSWDSASVFSKKVGSSYAGRPSSIRTRASSRRRDSVSTQPANERIMSWRQDITSSNRDSDSGANAGGSLHHGRRGNRSVSPRKSFGGISVASSRPRHDPSGGASQKPPSRPNTSSTSSPPSSAHKHSLDDPASSRATPPVPSHPLASFGQPLHRLRTNTSLSSTSSHPVRPTHRSSTITEPATAAAAAVVDSSSTRTPRPPDQSFENQRPSTSHPRLEATTERSTSTSTPTNGSTAAQRNPPVNPLWLHGTQSWAFWNPAPYREQLVSRLRAPFGGGGSSSSNGSHGSNGTTKNNANHPNGRNARPTTSSSVTADPRREATLSPPGHDASDADPDGDCEGDGDGDGLLAVPLSKRASSVVSRLSSEEEFEAALERRAHSRDGDGSGHGGVAEQEGREDAGEDAGEEELVCGACGGRGWRARVVGGSPGGSGGVRRLVCEGCGEVV